MTTRDAGIHVEAQDDHTGQYVNSEYHWRGLVSADHDMADNTDYDQISDSDWKRFYVSGYYTEQPESGWGTRTIHEEFRASIEPRDNGNTATRTPEPDPTDASPSMPYDLSISAGIGPLSVSHSLTPSSLTHTDRHRDNQYWHHWEIPTGDMPVGADDAHGVSVELDTLNQVNDQFSVGGFTSSTFSYTDPSWGGTAFFETDAVGGFADFTVVDGDIY